MTQLQWFSIYCQPVCLKWTLFFPLI
jgi:hypothetical protein